MSIDDFSASRCRLHDVLSAIQRVDFGGLASWLFLIAYTCSGLAGLIYEVTWTRLLTLYIGHTTAAASTVVAAFLGGLAIGAAAGGRFASTLSARRSLQTYVGLELTVAVCALLLPFELRAFAPALSSAYQDGSGGFVFPLLRVVSCGVMVFIPALALGATFPMAIRWFARRSDTPVTPSSTLYFVNTAGAAVGALLAGFVFIPRLGMSGSVWVAMAGSALAAACVAAVLRFHPADDHGEAERASLRLSSPASALSTPPWLAMSLLGASGFAALVHEIAWTRILSLLLGPTTYAFAATLAAVIAGVALGSGTGTWLVAKWPTRAAGLLSFTLALAAATAGWTYSIAGSRLPMMVAREVAEFVDFDRLLVRGVLLTMALILPTAACLGAAFPLALSLADDRAHAAAGRFGLVYAINTIGSVTGSLVAGFLLIPMFGLQVTLWVVSGVLIAAAVVLIASNRVDAAWRIAGAVMVIVSGGLVISSPPWDRELLASGAYMYAPYVPKDLDLATQLKAGELLYYKEGASATVSVKKLTGTTTLAVDGKTDASNRGDVLTQKLIAHLPLLMHRDPKEVFIIGLGSGMTAGAALTHPIARADVIEISPEVVAASDFFKVENRNALSDPRTRLVIGDGRSHLALAHKQYDVIISEPSNPWIAGVSSLFTQEFFTSARARLAPGGIMCQWVNAYNINDADLKSVIATFRSVFPDGTVWLVGGDDVLLLATLEPLTAALARMDARMANPDVAADLSSLGVMDVFSLRSLQQAGPAQLATFAGAAPVFTDDHLTLEFTAPRELHSPNAGKNGAALRALNSTAAADATATQLRQRAAMLAKADHYEQAYGDYMLAVRRDANDVAALDGLVTTAVILKKADDALSMVRSIGGELNTVQRQVAVSKLLAASGQRDEALSAAREAIGLAPQSPAGYEQLASLLADAADTVQLDAAVAELRKVAPAHASTEFYAAVAAFLHGNAAEAVSFANKAIDLDPNYTATYDLIGAALTKLAQIPLARQAFDRSLSFNAHDSTAYENLGILALNAGYRDVAVNYFAEALWLDPASQVARQGLAQARR